jgi:hypothetical protein
METPIKLKKLIELLTSIEKMGCEVVNITVNPQVVDIEILDGDAIYKKNSAVLRQKNTPVNLSFREPPQKGP